MVGAEAKLDLDRAVAAHPRTYGEGEALKGELEEIDFQAFGGNRDFAVGGLTRGAERDAQGALGFDGGDDDDGSLDAKHFEDPSDGMFEHPGGDVRRAVPRVVREVEELVHERGSRLPDIA